jgi:glutamate 5-kinase
MHKRVIIKVGTKVLTDKAGNLDQGVIKNIVDQIIAIRNKSYEVILVSSGAVGSGRALLKSGNKEETIADKQVFAAVGQVALMNTYAQYLKKYNIQSAQILVTKEDFRDRVHYQNMETCFLNVLRDNVLPIVNENDVVAVKELIFTDNDELTSLIALQLDAEAVFILTSVNGVIAGDISDPKSEVISEIKIDELRSAEKHITTDKSSMGRGGMLTKFAMARKMISAGITVYILNGKKKNGMVEILNGKQIGTKFVPNKKISSRKRRLAHGDSLARGSIVINKCVEDIISSNDRVMSILPIGVVSTAGDFRKGDIIKVVTEKGKVVGCGIARSDEVSIKSTLGRKGGRAIIHYDDLFIY